MVKNEIITYFTLNRSDKKIIQCDKKKYLGLEFSVLYSEVLENLISNKSQASYSLNNVLDAILKLKPFTFTETGLLVKYDVKAYDENSISCTVLLSSEDASFNQFDFLTSLYNRSYVTKEIERRLKKKEHSSYALGIIDLNNFKNINDKYGHLIGDKVLKAFSKSIRLVVKDHLVGRYGGDEFVIFIENPNKEELIEISKAILNISYAQSNSKKDIVTACLGFTLITNPDVNFDFLFEKADVALYKAKRSNKNSAYLDDELLYIKNASKHDKDKIGKLYLLKDEIKNMKLISFTAVLGIMSVIILIFSFSYTTFKNNLTNSNEKEMKNTMSMVSDQLQTTINSNIDSLMSQLKMVEQVVKSSNSDSPYNMLVDLNNDLVYEELGFLKSNGEIRFSDRSYNILREKLANEIILKKKSYVDNIYITGKGERMIFAIPFTGVDEIVGIIGSMTIETFQNYLISSSFNNKASIAITTHEGNRLVSSSNSIVTNNNILLFFMQSFDQTTYNSLKNSYLNYETMTVDVIDDDIPSIMFFTPFKKTISDDSNNIDWHIVISVPKSEINAATTKVFSIILLTFVITSIVLATIICGIALFVISTRIRFKYIRYIDDLTDGLNFNRFNIDAFTLCHDNKDYAVVLSDIIKFKYINEEIGKQKGDELIRRIHGIYTDELNKNEIIGRVYADRFVLLIKDTDIEARLNRINEHIKKTLYDEFHVNIIILFGVYAPNKKIDDIPAATNMARIALQSIKNNYAITPIGFFNDSMYVNELERNELERKADTALINHDFIVYYQAKRNIQTNTWASSEALVRWRDTDNTLIPPYKFIPLFEENGFVTKLDLYVFDQVCQDIVSDIKNGVEPIPVSFNVSRLHLIDENFLDLYQEIIAKYNVPSKYLEFEITESAIFENETLLQKVIKRIHEMGCKCAIDDFGTGYSSLSMLTNYNFDVIKFDRSFFYGKNGFTENSKVVVKTIIELGHKLGKEIVAEGIEELEMVEYLRNIGCDIIQGYYYAKPMPLADYLKLKSNNDIGK